MVLNVSSAPAFAAAGGPASADSADPVSIDLNDQPGHLIRRAQQIAVSVFHETVGREVTPIQYAILRILQGRPGIDQLTLAREAALDTSTTADIAVRLEAKGWIVREVRARGQRRLTLTADGLRVLAALVDGIDRVQQTLLGRLDAADQAEFLRLLRVFVRSDLAPDAPDDSR